MATLISSLAWVRRGVAAQNPQTYTVDDEELKRVSKLAREELADAELDEKVLLDEMGEGADEEDHEEDWEDVSDDENGMEVDKKDPNDLSEYKLDEYDDDVGRQKGSLFSNIKGLTYYKDNEDDPYITLKDEEDEKEELEVYSTDNLLVAAKTEDEIAQLEVYVYDESADNLYVHHDLLLPSLPLCLEWLDFSPGTSLEQPSTTFGNFIAVGTFEPEIEIWSLDTVDALFPTALLGRPDKTKAHVPTPLGTGKKKKKKQKPRGIDPEHHVDAVLSLSWNRTHRNLLASASADKTVKLWDLSRELVDGSAGGAIRSFEVHKDKVQAVQWNAMDPSVLLTGSYDRTVRTFDSRAPDVGVGSLLGADVEAVRWDPWQPQCFYVSLENGLVVNFDARMLSNDPTAVAPTRFTLAAHDGAASALDVNPHIRGCILTGGTDKLVKVWNVNELEGGEKRDVSLVTSRDLGVGKVFSASWSPDDALTVAAAGSKGKLQIWDIAANSGVRKSFAQKLREANRTVKEKQGDGLVGVASDDEEDEEDEE